MAIVRVDPELAAAVLRLEDASRTAAPVQGYVVWLIARSLDGQGAGRVPRDLLRTACVSSGISRRRFARWLAAAYTQGFLRGRAGAHVRYRSLREVCLQLQLTSLDGSPVDVRVHASSLKRVRAALLGAWLAGMGLDEKTPINQADIRAATAIAPRTQSEYTRLVDCATVVVPNVGIDVEVVFTPEEAELWLNAQRGPRGSLPGPFIVRALGGNGQVNHPAYHLPNSYSPLTPRAPRGQRRRLHRLLSGHPLMRQSGLCVDIQRRYAGDSLTADQDLDHWSARENTRNPATLRLHVYHGRTKRSGVGHWVTRSAASAKKSGWRQRLQGALAAKRILADIACGARGAGALGDEPQRGRRKPGRAQPGRGRCG